MASPHVHVVASGCLVSVDGVDCVFVDGVAYLEVDGVMYQTMDAVRPTTLTVRAEDLDGRPIVRTMAFAAGEWRPMAFRRLSADHAACVRANDGIPLSNFAPNVQRLFADIAAIVPTTEIAVRPGSFPADLVLTRLDTRQTWPAIVPKDIVWPFRYCTGVVVVKYGRARVRLVRGV